MNTRIPKQRALTDEQNAIADRVMAAIAGTDPDDAFAAFVSIMAATINGQSTCIEAAMARGEMIGQRFVDLIVEGRNGSYDTAGAPRAIDVRFLI